MVFLRAKGMQQSPRNIILQATVYYAMIKRTVIPIKDTKKECTDILNKKKVRLLNDETSRSNPDSSSSIYLNSAKVAQYILVYDNRREKE